MARTVSELLSCEMPDPTQPSGFCDRVENVEFSIVVKVPGFTNQQELNLCWECAQNVKHYLDKVLPGSTLIGIGGATDSHFSDYAYAVGDTTEKPITWVGV